MYEPLPRMPLSLSSRASRVADMAEALYWAIDELGLRLPSRRDIARHSRVSEATISRRLRDARGNEEGLATLLVSAREHTYPPGFDHEGWSRWLPRDDLDLGDVRAWVACLAMARQGTTVVEAVRRAWERELPQLVCQLTGSMSSPDEQGPATLADAEAVQALLLGLSIRQVHDAELTPDRAVELVQRVVAALGHDHGDRS